MNNNHSLGAWIKRLPWLVYCRKCGLIRLRNDRTERALSIKCDG